MYTLPSPRWKAYQPSNFQVIQNDITDKTNEIVEKLGFYDTRSHMGLI